FKDELFKNVLEELSDQAKVKFKPDLKGGISQNRKVTYTCKNKPLEAVLDEILKKEDWGYVVKSDDKDVQYDGAIVIKVGKERGYEAGSEPAKAVAKKDDKKAAGKTKDKEEMKKDEAKKEAKPKEDKPKEEAKPAESDEEK